MNTLISALAPRNLRQKIEVGEYAEEQFSYPFLEPRNSIHSIIEYERAKTLPFSLEELLEVASRDSDTLETLLMCSGQDPIEKLLSLLAEGVAREDQEGNRSSSAGQQSVSAIQVSSNSNVNIQHGHSRMSGEDLLSDALRLGSNREERNRAMMEYARLNAAMKGLEDIGGPHVAKARGGQEHNDALLQFHLAASSQPRPPFMAPRPSSLMAALQERMFSSPSAMEQQRSASSEYGGDNFSLRKPPTVSTPSHVHSHGRGMRSSQGAAVEESIDPVLELALLLREEQNTSDRVRNLSSLSGFLEGSSMQIMQTLQSAMAVQGPSSKSHQEKVGKSNTSRYESQKGRDWISFGHFLSKCQPAVSILECTDSHVIEFLNYLDQYGKTKVHNRDCDHFGTSGTHQCDCPLKQAWGSLDSLVGRLRAAFDKHNEASSRENPFGTRKVRTHLLEIRDYQAKARGVLSDKKKRKAT